MAPEDPATAPNNGYSLTISQLSVLVAPSRLSTKRVAASQIGEFVKSCGGSKFQDRRLTYRDLQHVAGASGRTVTKWTRGATSPMAMNGLPNLIPAAKTNDAIQVLALCRQVAI